MILLILVGSILTNIIFIGLAINNWNSIRPFVIKNFRAFYNFQSIENLKNLNKICEFIKQQTFYSESVRIDFIRNWVFQNSIHKIDKEHERYAFNTKKVMSMLWETHQTSKNHAHLSCGPRAIAMKTILDNHKTKSRLVHIFTDVNTQINSHTFLEVLNNITGQWELHDPDFNVYYVDSYTKKRVSTLRLIFGDLNSITPISNDKIGWRENGIDHLLKNFFKAVMYDYRVKGEKSTIFINSSRFNTSKLFVKNGNITFLQFAKKHYSNPVLIVDQSFNNRNHNSLPNQNNTNH